MSGLKVLITGGNGMLGSAFTEHLVTKRHMVHSRSHEELDVTKKEDVLKENDFAPDWIIHTAGIVNADYCEEHSDECFRSHVE